MVTCNLRRHTERRFCCGRCHRAFSSTAVFDAHRVTTADEGRVCVDPGTLTDRDGSPRARAVEIPGLIGHVVVWGSPVENLEESE